MSSIYLISPPKIILKDFLPRLEDALATGLVPVFQLRVKDYEASEVKMMAKEMEKICRAHECLFILNDDYKMAWEVGAGGVHLGEGDRDIAQVRSRSPMNFIIGASCYDSKHLAMEAGEQGADYVSFGTFFPSKTKNSRGKPKLDLLSWCSEFMDLPIVAIGGIAADNCHLPLQAGADFIAVISTVWDDENGEVEALNKLDRAMKGKF